MTFLKRTLSFLVLLALLVPGASYPVLADEQVDSTAPASETTVSADTTSTASAQSETATTDTQTNQTTQTDSADTSSSVSTTSTSQETDTATHESVTGSAETTATARDTLPDASTTPPVLVSEGTTTAPSDVVVATATNTSGTSESASTATATVASTTPAATATTITTGDATAGANVVNVTNSNFVNSSGEIVLANYFGSTTGIDLRSATSSFATGALCLLFACTGSQGVSMNLMGTSSLDNAFALNATTGGNTISTPSDASIFTGNALVGLNLVNLANLNIVDSNYLIAALNIFNGLTGDIVFPSLAGFFDALGQGTTAGAVTLASTAAVDNAITFDAGTGNNTALATTSSVTTGSTQTLGNLLNQLNSSAIGGANLAIVLRVQGLWNGEIFGAPSGLVVTRGDDGSIYITSASARPSLADGDASLAATSTALITNHIGLGAFTGDNGIFGADSARIVTGNARAAANVVTLANQNIIGRNWLTAVVNIFGDFTGNIAFGRPDLWVGERVEAPAPLTDGSDVVVHFTLTNKGDAPASAVSFTPSFDSTHLTFLDTAPDTTDLGTLAPGASVDIAYHAQVHAQPGTDVVTSGTASAHETDNNLSDNTDTVTLHTLSVGGAASSGGQSLVSYAVSFPQAQHAEALPLTVVRHTAHATAGSGIRTVHEELSVRNPNDATSSPIDLHDLVKDPSGTVIQDQAWPLDTLAPHEEVTVSYDTVFNDAAPTGTYTLSTVLASDVAGDTEYRDNGTIVFAGVTALRASPTPRAPGAVTVSAPTIVHTPAPASVSPAGAAALNPLLAAVVNARIPWTYALGFVAASALLAGFLWSVLWMRRRHF